MARICNNEQHVSESFMLESVPHLFGVRQDQFPMYRKPVSDHGSWLLRDAAFEREEAEAAKMLITDCTQDLLNG